jgi:L-threonylcarbamoyladenylate synthase
VTVLSIEPTGCTSADLGAAATWLHRDGIVAFPTDTFYGLAVNPASSAAVTALFDLKGRAASAPVPLVAASTQQVEHMVGPLTSIAAMLAAKFWPGPLSLLFDTPAAIAREVDSGRGSVAIRVPAHRVARELCAAFGEPLTATSANLSGAPPVVSAAALGALTEDARVLVIDGGDTAGGLPSTIVDPRGASLLLVRDGSIAWNRVLESLRG